MQPRSLELRDLGKKCGFLLSNVAPEKNVKLLLGNNSAAYVLYKDDLYYIDSEATPDNRCVHIKLENKKLAEIKSLLKLNNEALSKDEKFRCIVQDLSSEQLESISSLSNHYPTWLHKIIVSSMQSSQLLAKSWEFETKFRELEKRIASLEELCPKKFTSADLEKAYPKEYKKSDVRPTDYKHVKLEELRLRIANLESSANKQALANRVGDLKDIAAQFNTDKSQYLKSVEEFQALDKHLSEYSKTVLTQENFRHWIRSDISKLPLILRIQLVAIVPGSTSLAALIDTFAQLKRSYEIAMCETYTELTGQKLKPGITIEEIISDLFKKPAKEFFKEFARKPTAEMANIKDEFEKINSKFWESYKQPAGKDELRAVFNNYFQTALYLSCAYETFRFTDKVQRLDVAKAVGGKLGSLFGGEDIAGEFLDKLTVLQIQNSFALLPFALSKSLLTEETSLLWLEVATWLKGVHQKSFDQIAPHFKTNGELNDGVFHHLGDDDDRNFFKHKPPMVKWSLAQYHEPHYKQLLRMLPKQLWAEMIPYLPNEFNNAGNSNSNGPSLAPKDVALEPAAAIVATVAETNSNGKGDDAISQKEEERSENVNLSNQTQSISRSTMGLFKSTTKKSPSTKPVLQFEDLNKFINCPVIRQRLTLFNTALQIHELPAALNSCIESLKPQIMALLTSYKDAYFTSGWKVPTVFVDQKHLKEVKTAWEIINTTKNPVDYLTALYGVWSSTLYDPNSKIGPESEKVLIDALSTLHIQLKPKCEMQHAM